jgi:predicted peptidase
MAQTVPVEGDRLLQSFEPREYHGSEGQVLRYRLMKPIDFHPDQENPANKNSDNKYPLVVFLHGAGERGSDNLKQLVWGMREFSHQERRRKYPAYVLAPQCPDEQKWVEVDWSSDVSPFPKEPSQPLALLRQLIAALIESAAVDPRRVYITGLSMGGYGVWDCLARYPDLFAAAAPICGGGDPETAERFKDIPMWCFHGADDTVVKPKRSREMIEALKKWGAEPKYTEYPGVGHNSWSPTFENPEFHAWLFSHRRPVVP